MGKESENNRDFLSTSGDVDIEPDFYMTFDIRHRAGDMSVVVPERSQGIKNWRIELDDLV